MNAAKLIKPPYTPDNGLWLMPSRELPRRMILRLGAELQVHVYAKQANSIFLGRSIGYASKPLSECRLELWEGHEAVWIGSASFDVTLSEVQEIRAAFPELRIVKSGAPV